MPRSRKIKAHKWRLWLVLFVYLSLLIVISIMLPRLAHAEGSRDLYRAGGQGNRANIEWRNSFYGNFLRRRSLFQVYAQAGEVLLLGSSAVGVDQGDIRVYDPNRVTGPVGNEIIPDTPDFSCSSQRTITGNPDQGRITSRAMELAGPDTITDTATASPGNAVPDGYVPCFYPVSQDGIYHVVFLGPAGADSDLEIAATGEIDLTSPDNFNDQQGTSIAVWDVTVRSDLTSTADINGRLFVDYLTRFTGSWPRPTFSSYFITIDDGYVYRTDMRGIDANGFVVYSNNIGFFDSDDSTLYHNVVAKSTIPIKQQNQLNELIGDVRLAPPTHSIFFNYPSDEARKAKGFLLEPLPPDVSSLMFEGRIADNNTFVGGGGIFTFTSSYRGSHEMIISRDGVDFSPDTPANRVIRGIHQAGVSNVVWDGLDNTGSPFPVGQNYQAKLTNRGGEHHFPMLDIESSLEGGPTFELLNPPNGKCPSFGTRGPDCNIAFYDDRGYVTADGTVVGTPGQVLPNGDPPSIPNSDPLNGFDTTTNQRSFGDGTANGFGDAKGLDLWTYYPSEPAQINFNILPLNITIQKTDNGITTGPGQVIVYTLFYTNTEAIDAFGTVITEVVPLHTTFNAAASQSTLWNCADGSSAGTTCTVTVGFLPSGNSGTATFAVTVSDNIPSSVNQIDNIVIIGEDGSRGPEPTIDNQDIEDTPLQLPTATPKMTPTPSATPNIPSTPPNIPSPNPSDDDDDDDDDSDDDDDDGGGNNGGDDGNNGGDNGNGDNNNGDNGNNDNGGDNGDNGNNGNGGDNTSTGDTSQNNDNDLSVQPTPSRWSTAGQTDITGQGTPPASTLAQVDATPAIPVTYLPETGQLEAKSVNFAYELFVGLGFVLLTIFVCWYKYKR